MKQRTKLRDRILPPYTRGEEITNMTTHIVGGAFGLAILTLCVIFAAIYNDVWAVTSSAIYGAIMVVLFTVSSTYHGLKDGMGKKVMQIIDHCTIFFLISGTYTPVLLAGIRREHPAIAWTVFGILWAITALAATLNAIDLKKYSKFSMICYIVMGWSAVVILKQTIQALTVPGFLWILGGGIAYTIGAVLYAIGKKKHIKFMHSVFHVFVVAAAIMQFFGIFFYIIL